MSEKKDSRKKALIITIFVFLACGGGIFLFFTFQGLGEYKVGNKGSFHYGFAVKSALTPLFSYFNQNDSEAELAKKVKKRLAARGLDVSLLDGSKADVSDWMKKSAGANSPRSPGAHRAAPPSRTPIPVMGGALGGLSMGGGGSQTTSGVSKFSGGNDGANLMASGGGPGGGGVAGGKKSTLVALANARASLGDGLRSGSAMTAKAKWDQGFGFSAGGKSGGALTYAKSGLAKMDRMESIDIGNLKNIDPGAGDGPEVSVAKEGVDLDPNALASKVKGSKDGQALVDSKDNLMNNMQLPPVGGGTSRNGPPAGGTPKGDLPPDNVLKNAQDKFCPNGCKTGDGSTYTDHQITYEKQPDGSYNVNFGGTQDGKNYTDQVNMKVGDDGKVVEKPIGSTVDGQPVSEFGANE